MAIMIDGELLLKDFYNRFPKAYKYDIERKEDYTTSVITDVLKFLELKVYGGHADPVGEAGELGPHT